MQISESHCGPAVIQMMLSSLNIEVNQEQVAEAGGANNLILMQGMRIDQLARAVRVLAPQVVFYYKDHATIAELVRVVIDYRHPAGVEWQGVFEDNDAARLDRANQAWSQANAREGLAPDSESQDNDYGHYSLVVNASRRRRELTVADPYKDFFSQARIFGFDEFDARWYDYNEFPDPLTGQPGVVKDDHMLFVITRRNVLFPLRMGMRIFEIS
jgi:hypothetical protein